MVDALDIHVKGIVQGVGFRPFVYRLAKKYLVNGWVLNAADGVHIRAEAEEKLLDEFVMELSENAPAAAQVTEIEMHEVPLEPYNTFEIRFSEDEETQERTLVSPDLATCADCERELFDSADRRFRYPFINCTNCGPRFTIIDELPYDRAATSMRDFVMCKDCETEYTDPADRRFHAQPNACFECGPHVSFVLTNCAAPESGEVLSYLREELPQGACHSNDLRGGLPQEENKTSSSDSTANKAQESNWGKPNSEGPGLVFNGDTPEKSDRIFEAAVKMLVEGKILAVKGLGGFHLVCDANNAEAVAELRQRKRREGKPFAVMMPSIEDIRKVCEVNDEEAAILGGSQRPIVLLRKRPDACLVPGVADELPELGVMLPYTPVQHILLHDFAQATASLPMLVMTSGNLHDESIVISDLEAREKLDGIADAILGNNREILSRFDDSVVRVIKAGSEGDAVQMIRRARGFAPLPIDLESKLGTADATVFATGPEQKNTFAFLRGREVFVSQHIGDMESAETFDAWIQAKERYEKLFDLHADELACDLHPEYITSKWAQEQTAATDMPLTKVQHHHAHVVSVMVENRLSEAVCGVAFDGTGYGSDGAIWGGEVLLSNLSAFERFANFAYVPMPGGAACVKHPLRMAYGVLWAFDLLDHPAAQKALEALGEEQLQICEAMIEQGLNTPMTSSVGRLFDAASALLGICTEPTYEGEPAILLEAAMSDLSRSSNLEGHGAGVEGETAEQAARYAISIVKNTATDASTAQDTSIVLLDAARTFEALLDDLAAGISTATISRRFHSAFVDAVVQVAQLAEALYGIRTVALAGGVFMNRYLIENSLRALEQAGFTVAINRELPPNDGCISCGQAVVAWAQNDK